MTSDGLVGGRRLRRQEAAFKTFLNYEKYLLYEKPENSALNRIT